MPAIKAQALSLKFKDKVLFDNANILIGKNEITGIIGKNGAGKTTFFDLICAIRRPDRGTLENLTHQHSYLSQTLGMPATLSMKEIYEMTAALSCARIPSLATTLQTFHAWDTRLATKFSETLKKRPSHCSYGEIRFFFTLSLISFAKELLILDEPTAGVDPESRHYIWSFIKKARENGATIIVSSHNIQEICEHCDSFHLIHNQQFSRFDSAQAFMSRFGGATLDDAFIASIYS
ncbi:ABC transporter ATP-binding protein [Pseudomonas sp. zfem002]|uniref:ABC transporter ATP-binding protein n=1 Tax=Pseudomonas sp. zfem002 TaxID=3078197 RepID=UPI002928CFF8|nr:ABC transporter ATP-binding protein [Pseudomonas sp. zfem002]MDU9393884.1 ABC transporter ATP-binding protein [Pseudomonas sp. zfem002]